jgi:valyl-tRNA synthetase
MPFISEELFQRLAKQNNVQVQTIMLQKYPENEEVNTGVPKESKGSVKIWAGMQSSY